MVMSRLKGVFFALVATATLFCVHSPGSAMDLTPDGFSMEAGKGERDMFVVRAAVQWDWNRHWFNIKGASLDGYFDLNMAWWHTSDWRGNNEVKNLGVIGFTPVFRFMKTDKKGPYVEAGVGISFFSTPYNNAGHNMGTSFQFADHVGVGYVFANNLDVGLRLQHYSNLNISRHNDGADLVFARVAWKW